MRAPQDLGPVEGRLAAAHLEGASVEEDNHRHQLPPLLLPRGDLGEHTELEAVLHPPVEVPGLRGQHIGLPAPARLPPAVSDPWPRLGRPRLLQPELAEGGPAVGDAAVGVDPGAPHGGGEGALHGPGQGGHHGPAAPAGGHGAPHQHHSSCRHQGDQSPVTG